MRNLKYLFLILLLSILFPSLLHADKLTGSWQTHPSFYQQVQKMIDGERYAYFLLHQQTYDTRYKDYKKPKTTLFRYDKSDPNAGIRAMSHIYSVFPTGIIAASYSPFNKALIASDIDGVVWVIPDSSDPYAIYGLDRITLPGIPHVNTITENPADGSIWIAASYGYASFSPGKDKFDVIKFTDFPIDWIVPIGNELIIFANETAYSAPISNLPAKLSDLSKLSVSGIQGVTSLTVNGYLDKPLGLMPLTSTSFAFLGVDNTSTPGTTLAIASKQGNSWKVMSLVQDNFNLLKTYNTFTVAADNNAYPNKEGYYVKTTNKAYQILRNINPDFTSSDPSTDFYKRAINASPVTSHTSMESASWDFRNFWYFIPFQGFAQDFVDGDTFSSRSNPIWPEAPVPFIAESMSWHPKYGLLVNNHSFNLHFDTNSPSVPFLLSGLQEDGWHNHTPSFTKPNTIDANTFNSARATYPISHPKGLAYDPSNPGLAYVGSDIYGWARINLDDPEETALHIGNSQNSQKNIPGFIDDCPRFSAWGLLCAFSKPQFDNKGNLWSLFLDYDESQRQNYSVALRYYTPDDLKSIRNAHTNPSDYKSMRTITLPANEMPSHREHHVVFTHPDNENLIAFEIGNYNSSIYIFDHNGTPGDTSDDRMTILNRMYDARTGDYVKIISPYYMAEDPVTGKLWASFLLGTFVIDPQLAFTDPGKAVSRVWVNTSDGKGERKILESDLINGIAADDFGRLWIATNNKGLICLSADRKTVEGEYNSSNSPLHTDQLYSVCYHPDRGSVIISTEDGLMEFFPTGYGGNANGRSVKISPTALTPSFQGLVTISGLPTGKSYVITDKNGKEIHSLGMPSGDVIQWDGTTSTGNRPTTGEYEIREKSTGISYTCLTIIN